MDRNLGRALFRLGTLAGCFLVGAVCGQALSAGMPEPSAAELRQYLSERMDRDVPVTGDAVLSTLSLYIRYPLFAALAGGTSAGGILLCAAAAVFGFSLSFSVGCFASAFGKGGVLLASAALGVRCAVTLPCFLWLAVSGDAAPRFSAVRSRTVCPQTVRSRTAWARGRRTAGRRNVLRDSPRLFRMAVCTAALVLGAGADLLLTPVLLRWAAVYVLG